jgi:hypothetical protein
LCSNFHKDSSIFHNQQKIIYQYEIISVKKRHYGFDCSLTISSQHWKVVAIGEGGIKNTTQEQTASFVDDGNAMMV